MHAGPRGDGDGRHAKGARALLGGRAGGRPAAPPARPAGTGLAASAPAAQFRRDESLACELFGWCAVAPQYGVFDCKPLAFVWAKFPEQYTPDNTVMLDDLRRNFIMNKQNGLVIRPFKRVHTSGASDRELFWLMQYLTLIGTLEKISHLDHRRWERYLEERGMERQP